MADINPNFEKALDGLAQMFPDFNQQMELFNKNTKKTNSYLVEELKNRDKWKKAFDDHLKKINEANGTGGLGGFVKALRSGQSSMEQHKSTLDALDQAIESLTDSTNDASKGAQRKELQDQRQALEQKIALSEFNASIAHTSKNLATNLTGSLASSTKDFVKGLQHGSSATELSSSIMNTAVDAAAIGAGAFSGAMQNTGKILETSSNPKLRGLGVAADFAGSMLGSVTSGASKLAKFGIEILSKEVEKTVTAFNSTSAAGALFTDGMTGMRNAAGNAGLTLEQFSKVVSSSSEVLARSGLGVSEATKKMGNVSSNLDKTVGKSGNSLRNEMLALGYSYEEQTALVADVMGDMRTSRSVLFGDDKAIAQQTAEYSKNLRVIASITGEDAKRKMEEQRAATTQVAYRLKLQELEKKQPGVMREIMESMTTLDPVAQKAVQQILTLGTVVDKSALIQMKAMGAYSEKITGMAQLIESGSFTVEKAQELQGKTNDAMQGQLVNLKEIGIAGQVGAYSELNTAISGTIANMDKVSDISVKTSQHTVEEQAKANDKLTKELIAAAKERQKLQLEQEKILGSLLGDYATINTKILSALNDLVNGIRDELEKLKTGKFGSKEEGFIDKAKRVGGAALSSAATGATIGTGVGAVAGGIGGAVIGTTTTGIGGPMGAFIGTELGGGAGAVAGAVLGGLVGAIKEAFWGEPGKAKGGISTGPTSGYMEKLHGTEAVVPLEGGRSIPVSLKMDDVLPKSLSTILANFKQDATDTKITAVSPTTDSLNKKTYSALSNFTDTFPKTFQSLLTNIKDQPTNEPSTLSADINNLTSTLSTFKAVDYSAVTPIESGRSKAATIDFSGLTTAFSAEFAKKYTENQAKKVDNLPRPESMMTAIKSTSDSDLAKLVREQTNILADIKNTLDSSRDLQQQYVYNSYS